MATAPHDLRSHAVLCPICMELFNNAKFIPCLHKFCLKCIDGHCRDNEPGDEVACPLCRHEFKIPESGVQGLVSNFFRAYPMEASNTASDVVMPVLCEVCVDDSDEDGSIVAASTMYCVDCDQNLCEQCSKPHRKMKGGPHKVVPIGSEVETELLQTQGRMCDRHYNKHFELFCIDCNVNICVTCFSEEHQQHKCNSVDAVAAEYIEQIDADVGQIMERAAGTRSEIRRLYEEILKFVTGVNEIFENIVERGAELKQLIDKQVDEHVKLYCSDYKMTKCMLRLADEEEVDEKIRMRGEELKQLIDKQVNELMAKVQVLKIEKCKEIESQTENVEMKLVAFETFNADCSELKSKGKPCDITRAVNDLRIRANELLQNDFTVTDYSAPTVTFIPTNIHKLFTGGQNLVGVVRSQNKTGCQTLHVTETICRVVDETDGFEIDDDNILMKLLSHMPTASGVDSIAFGTTVSSKCIVETPTSKSSSTSDNMVSEDVKNIDETSQTRSVRNDNSTPYNLEQKHTASLTGISDNMNVESVPPDMTTFISVIGDVIITQQEYNTITKIIQTPVITDSSTSEENFRTILPYIRQRVKMRGCHVLQPGRITALFADETKPAFSVIIDPFEQSSTPQQLNRNESYPINRLDFITCLLNSADDIVKSDLLSIMAQFSMALPLVMRNCDECTYSMMPLYIYGVRVKWETGSCDSQRLIEHSLFRDKYRLIVAVRLGKNHTGKSTILNQLFAKEHIFSSAKESGARYGKPLSLNGTVEMVWLTRETCKDNFWSTISKFYGNAEEPVVCLLANLHGDATEFPETIQLLSEIFSCRFLVFIHNNCSPEKWTNFLQCVGKERIAFTIRVDPANYQAHNLNDILTSQLLGDETHEKIRQIISNVLESCVPSTYADKLNCTRTGKVSLPGKIGTTESQSLVTFVEEKSCKTVKEKMKLQGLSYSKDSLAEKRSILKGNAELSSIIKLISSVLNLPRHSLQRAMVHLEKELTRLSDIATQTARDKSSQIRNKLGAEKMKDNNESAISKVKEELNSALKEIGDCYLAVEHLFREISCVHEVLQSDPTIYSIHRNVAGLFIDGQAIELVDGDVCDVPECWLKSIFGAVEKMFPHLRVFVVSVIGLQSSGKSTLLNTLFACRFAVSVGRCTRGLFMRLLFMEKELVETHKFDAILLIDTEGFGAPEKMNDPETAKRDRQMATFAMSISNLTLINILGENMVEMAAILQIAIVALTRIQLANISPDIMMIQCLTGEKNLQKAAAGQDSFIAAISKALEIIRTNGIQIGAKGSECLSELKKRVEHGNMLFQVRSYKDGATANAPPSEVYHEDAVELCKTILNCGRKSTKSTFVFSTWHLLVTESWKAAGRENFASRFEDIKAVIEYIVRMETIALCKRSIDEAFYVHERQLKESVETKVNDVTIEELRNNENEKFFKWIHDKLKVIPGGCQEKDKCKDSCRQIKLLYRSIDDERVRTETTKSINDHTTRIRESSMNMLRKMFEAEIVRRGCSVEFDSRINEAALRYLAKRRNETLSEAESAAIAATIFRELKTFAAKMNRPTPINETFVADLITVYNVYPEMGQTFQTSFMFQDVLLSNEDDSLSRELQYLKNRLGALPDQIITKASAECYDHRIMEELKSEVEMEFKKFQESNDKLCNNISEVRLHIWVQQLLLECVISLHKKWDEKTNPPSILKANKQSYLAMIQTRLVHGFGYKSEGNIMAGHIAHAIRLRATEKVDQQLVDGIKNQPWTTSSVVLRVRYFIELALKLKKGDKPAALSHFLEPEESIKKWFANKIDTDVPEKAKKLFETNIKIMCEEEIKHLSTVHKIEDILRIVWSYYGSYSPAKQVDFTNIKGENFDMLKTELLTTLHSLRPATFRLKHKLSENKEIKKCLGCTQTCFWCGAFCWFCVDHGNEHSTSHQPAGLHAIMDKTTKRLLAQPCHETKDDTVMCWGKFYEKGMRWGRAKAEHFSDWTFQLFKEKKFDDLMRWFFQELHVDIAKQKSTKERQIKPASDADLEKFGCKGLHFSTIMTDLLNDLTSFKDDPFIKELNAEIKKEQMQLINFAR